MTRPKMSALVASAIRNLREIRGSTSKEIMNYIKSQYAGTDTNIQKQIYTALKRGLEYGILKRDRGYYSLNTDPDLLYKANTVGPLEQGRRRRRRRGRRRGRRVSRRGRRRSRRGRRRRRRRRGRGRGRSRSPRSRESSLLGMRSLTAKCNCPSTRKRTEDNLRNSPVENLRKDMTYLYKKSANNQTPSRHQSRSRDRSQTRSRSSSSDKEMIDDRNREL